MLDWEIIEQAFHTWALAKSGLQATQIRFSYAEWVIPVRPLLTFRWISRDEPVGLSAGDGSQVVLDNPDATVEYQHIRTHSLQMDWFAYVPKVKTDAGNNASAALGNLLRTLNLQGVRQGFLDAGIGLQLISPVRDLTQIVESEFETRASADIQIQTSDSTLDQQYKITTVLPPTGTVHT